MAIWSDKPREPRVLRMQDTEAISAALDLMGSQKPVDPDHTKTVTNSAGGKQSKMEYAVGSADPLATLAMAKVQAEGDAKYGKDNWRLIGEDCHIGHALTHIALHRAGDTAEAHLAHALTRLHMAMAVHLRPDYRGDYNA